LFVSLSFHLDVLIHDTRAHLLAHARSTLLSFVYVMLVSLVFQIPRQRAPLLGASLTTASGLLLAITFVHSRRAAGVAESKYESFLRRCSFILMAAYAFALLNSVLIWVLGEPELAYNYIGVICLLLGNAAGTAWDLLVDVGKLKAEAQGASER